MRITFNYKAFVEIIAVATNVLKLDKKLNTETRVVTLVAPASKGLTQIDLYANTHSIQTILQIEATVETVETTYLDINMKKIQEIISSFGKGPEYQPDTITFQRDAGSFRYLIYLSRIVDEGEAENFTFAEPYNPSQTYFIAEINKVVQPIEQENKWITLGVQDLEEPQASTPEEIATHLKAQQNNPVTFLYQQLSGIAPLFKFTGVHINNVPYIEFSSQRVYMQTLSTLTLYKDQPDVHPALTGFKLAEDPAMLLHALAKTGSLTIYNDVDTANLVLKTTRGIYVLNYKTALFDYRNTLKLVGNTDWVKVGREDFIMKIRRLKLTEGRTEASFSLNPRTKKYELNLRNLYLDQDVYIKEAEGDKIQDLKFNLIPKILDEVLPPLVASKSEFLYIYFDVTPEGVWTLRFEDETRMWETYISVQTFKEHSFKSMKEI